MTAVKQYTDDDMPIHSKLREEGHSESQGGIIGNVLGMLCHLNKSLSFDLHNCPARVTVFTLCMFFLARVNIHLVLGQTVPEVPVGRTD